ncbi:MAG: hypothetical protein I8H75_04015 [Myxococcaceae bacterium]|nr:hypothetical protein [Myxococcaceae bacterium]MBH2006493.1 hypothetical protein [Myxococcaceae bacterium]
MNQLITPISYSLQEIRQMPAQDLLITIRDRGLHDSLAFLGMLSPEQFQYIMDLDAWTDDRIQNEKIEPWLEAMMESNPRKAVQVFHELDIELLAFLLRENSEVYELDDGQEPDDLPNDRLQTPDNRYVITFSKPIWRHFFEHLMARDLTFALQIMQSIRYETASGLEEEAFRWRDGRMQDLGFAPYEEAKAVLSRINPDISLEYPTILLEEEPTLNPTQAIVSSLETDHVFTQTLSTLPNDTQKRILSEFVSTCNQVHQALNRDSGDRQSLRETVQYVTLLLDKALHYRSPEVLATSPVRTLFQIGRTLENA